MRKLRMSELNRLSVENFKEATKLPLAIVLDDIRSTLNVGSVFRTADAFLVAKLLLCGISPEPNREMNKTALGATETVSWQYLENVVDAVMQLKSDGFSVWAVEQTDSSVKLQDFRAPAESKIALVFGNEVKGVSDVVLALCDGALEIPQLGSKHSLNISVSAGIALWELAKVHFK